MIELLNIIVILIIIKYTTQSPLDQAGGGYIGVNANGVPAAKCCFTSVKYGACVKSWVVDMS
jgi:hypothetical protein